MTIIYVDPSKKVGKIKPLHGINNSPVSLYEPRKELAEAGIPYCRLHDAAGDYGGTHYVDIPNVFPDFDADPNLPESYDFAFTDAYIKQLVAAGMEPFYRLGVTIENNYKIKAYQIHPPKDFQQWAKICVGIVRHYTEGWADGFHYNMKYWEIWGEPENPPLWSGTREEYFELYRITANCLKKEFPNIKVGGYGGCGFYTLTRDKQPDFFDTFVPYFEEFLKFVTNTKTAAPLDFYSWHLYTADPQEIIVHADFVDSRLKEYKLTQTELIFNEWNYMEWNYIAEDDLDVFDTMKEAPGASFVASAFCKMQKSPIDKAMYYDALPTRTYCGLYYFPSLKVTKTYYAFKAFNELYKLGVEVESSVVGEDIAVCAAASGVNHAVLIVNFSKEERFFELNLKEPILFKEAFLIDETHCYEKIKPDTNNLKLSPFSVLLFMSSADGESKQETSGKEKIVFAGIDTH